MRYLLQVKPDWSTLVLYDDQGLELPLNPILDDGETVAFETTGHLRYRAGTEDAHLDNLPPGTYFLTLHQPPLPEPPPTRLHDMLRVTLSSGLGFLGGTVAVVAALTLVVRFLLADFQGVPQLSATLAAGLAALAISIILNPNRALKPSVLVLTIEAC